MNTSIKTLEECKDEVAKKHDYPCWYNLLHDLIDENVPMEYIDAWENEATDLYASQFKSKISQLEEENKKLKEELDKGKA